MILTLHIDKNNISSGVATFSIPESYNCKKVILKSVYGCGATEAGTTGMLQKDPMIFGKFNNFISNCYSVYSSSTTSQNTFPLGILKTNSSLMFEGDLLLAEDINFSNNISINIFEIINTNIYNDNIDSFFESGEPINMSSTFLDITLELDLNNSYNSINDV